MATAEITMELGRPRSRRRRWFVAILSSLVVFVAAAWVAQRVLLTTSLAPRAATFSAGPFHTCGIQPTRVVCWGDNDHLQLGLLGAPTSAALVTVPGLRNVSQISAGYHHTCALRTNGEVSCWGAGGSGALGDGEHRDSAVPVTVVGLHDATSVSAGDGRSCAVRATGNVVCWGAAAVVPPAGARTWFSGGSSRPITVRDLDDVVAVRVGKGSACALRAAGDVRCWGDNLHGELGDGTFDRTPGPVRVSGIGHATQITVGGDYACALQGGRELCWGAGYGGRLAGGDLRSSPTPVAMRGLTGVTQISGTCALRADIGVACWGAHVGGSSALPLFRNAYAPVMIDGLDDAIAVSSGDLHACAILEGERMTCWGNDAYEQLGPFMHRHEAAGTVI